jgi:hypothetical protein
LTLLFLALWVPATVHCQLERAFVLEATACGDHSQESETGRNCCDSNCKALENGFVKGNTQTSGDRDIALLLAAAVILEPPDVTATQRNFPTSVPPDLSPAWQFAQRAALPVRAPSFLS